MKALRWLLLLICCSAGVAEAQIEELVSPGELSSAHAKLAGLKNCNVCHQKGQGVPEWKCLDCHKDLAARIRAKKGFHANKATNCVKCHTEHLGRDFDIRDFDVTKFHHDETGFKLEGKHAAIKNCAACHKTRSFLGLSRECATCHKDPHKAQLPTCTNCHSVFRSMKEVTFDHSKTAFPLQGAHQKVPCLTCHKNQVFKGLPYASCTSCHVDKHQGAMGKDCLRCHTMDSWKGVQIKHEKFPLTGKHAQVACEKCHPGGKWKLTGYQKCSSCHVDPHLGQFTPQRCEDCHTTGGFKPAKIDHSKFVLRDGHKVPCQKCHKLQKGTFPAGEGSAIRYKPMRTECAACHVDPHAGQLGPKCEQCHNISSFQLKAFDHSKTRFPLDATHAKVPCQSCHKKDPKTGAMKFKPLGINCASCHVDPHKGQFTAACETCHTPQEVVVNHNNTRFALTGKHAEVPCEKCHAREKGTFPSGPGIAIRFKPIATDCKSCHEDYHRGQFQKDCKECHTTSGFKPATFTHDQSKFPLTGTHIEVPCSNCHKPEQFATPPPPVTRVRFKPVAKECARCHADPHKGEFGKDCERCHTTDKFKNTNFHHDQIFPLVGRHAQATCVSCHINNRYKGTPRDCYGCHRPDYERTKAPNHRQAGFSTSCETCHNVKDNDWQGAKLNHNEFFPLVGQHATAACASCHRNEVFSGTPRDCYGCHRPDYEATRAPNHRQSGFSTNCESCHKVSDPDWNRANFNHSSVFPLVGRHATAACASCHKNNVFRGTPRDCYGCHRADYDATRAPNHRKSGFSTDCESCHKVSDGDWNRANFNHTSIFPLVGRHATLQCAACHKGNVFKGTPRDCFGCHRTDYDRAKQPDHRAAGFPTQCDSCHRPTDTSWNRASFNHNSFFPLSGRHATAACAACHRGNVYRGTPRECYGCHRSDYDQTRSPNHRAAGFPTQCDSCHRFSDSSWNQARFDHSFPITSGRHAGLNCSSCHLNQGTFRTFTCTNCHTRGETDEEHDDTRGYRFDSPACYACHPRGTEDD